jgi:4-amino-4-deoxy-L-arabinose transferase-like glycosyltransferase
MSGDEPRTDLRRTDGGTPSVAGKLALLLIAALLLRAGVGLAWQLRLDRQGQRFGFGDSESYWALAETIAKGEPYQFGSEHTRVFRTPGYPLLLAPLFLVFGDDPPIVWARLESACLGTLAVLGVFLLGRHLFDRQAGLAAALLAAFYPGGIALSALVLSEAPFCAILPFNLWLWSAAFGAGSTRRAGVLAVAAGLAAAAAALVRPSWLLFVPFAVGLGLVAGRSRLRQAGIGAGVLAGLLLGMAPWWIRNWQVTGHFVPTTLQVGAGLYDGQNPRATGASDMWFTDEFARKEMQEQAAGRTDPKETFEYRLDRRKRDAALEWAGANPGRVIHLAGVKFLRIWNVWPNEAAFSSWPIRLVVMVGYLPILVLALLGVYRTFGRGWPYAICWLPAVYFTLLHMVFVGSIRYRDPAMLGLTVLAAGVLTAWNRGRHPQHGTSER